MRGLNWNLSKILFILCIVMFAPLTIRAQSEEVSQPLYNKGLLLIEKEMLRLSDIPKKSWSESEKNQYRALLFLEDYFLNRGVTPWTMKVLHRLIKMRDNTQDNYKKAFLECEAWKVLDHDLKNNENKDLIQNLMDKRKFTKKDHVMFRKMASAKVSSCIGFIGTNWSWKGPAYADLLYDVKTRNAIESVKTSVKIREISSEKTE